MKRYLTMIFIGLGILSVIISFRFDVRWNGAVAFGLALIFLTFAAISTKHIPDDKQNEEEHS